MTAPAIVSHWQHLNVTSVDEHLAFWVGALGATPVTAGRSHSTTLRLSGVQMTLTERPPSGGTKGTTVNHLGFQVPSLRAALERVRAAGLAVVTRAELPAHNPVVDDIGFVASTGNYVSFVMAPDETKVELVDAPAMAGSVALHHVHLFAPDVEAMRAWYVQNFGGSAEARGSFQTAELPCVSLRYSPSASPVVGTRGRALDRLGFDVTNLGALVARLEAAGATADADEESTSDLSASSVILVDPWGTRIEINELNGTS
jgi:catechol 2,3-dioxygenase-like lactoylglutathione lyase family enzyme